MTTYLIITLLLMFIGAPLYFLYINAEIIFGFLDLLLFLFAVGCTVVGLFCVVPDSEGFDADAFKGGLILLGIGVILLILFINSYLM